MTNQTRDISQYQRDNIYLSNCIKEYQTVSLGIWGQGALNLADTGQRSPPPSAARYYR